MLLCWTAVCGELRTGPCSVDLRAGDQRDNSSGHAFGENTELCHDMTVRFHDTKMQFHEIGFLAWEKV